MIIYKDIIKKLKDAGYNSTVIRKNNILPQSVLQRLRNGTPITTETINTICKLTGCKVEDLIEYVDDDKTDERLENTNGNN